MGRIDPAARAAVNAVAGGSLPGACSPAFSSAAATTASRSTPSSSPRGSADRFGYSSGDGRNHAGTSPSASNIDPSKSPSMPSTSTQIGFVIA